MAKIQDFLVQVVDKFNDKTTTTVNVKLALKPNESFCSATIGFRHISMPDGDLLLIDVLVQRLTWGHFEQGMLTFNINNTKNIKFQPHNQEKFAETIDHTTYVFESNFYEITQEQLKELCDANCLDIQISGKGQSIEMSGQEFISYCRLFYNQFYDEQLYDSTITDYWPRLRSSANWNNTKQTASNVFAILEGCAGMAALLLTIGAGAIFGIVKLISTIIA